MPRRVRLASQILRHDDWARREVLMDWYLSPDTELFYASFHPQLSHCLEIEEVYENIEYWIYPFIANTLRRLPSFPN